jgi:hypothetical protein
MHDQAARDSALCRQCRRALRVAGVERVLAALLRDAVGALVLLQLSEQRCAGRRAGDPGEHHAAIALEDLVSECRGRLFHGDVLDGHGCLYCCTRALLLMSTWV